MTLQVRPARPEDVPTAADVLADAFADHPWTRWTVDADAHAQRLTGLFRLDLGTVALPYGHVDIGTTPEGPAAVAVWLPSAAVPEDVWAEVGAASVELAGSRAAAAAAAEAVLAPHRSGEEHLLLASVGVVRRRQGRGLGTAALAAGLTRADRDGLPVRLETSAESTVRLYRRLGFAVTAVVDLPDGGPRTWLMRRAPCRADAGGPA
ncbi:acetyltransferase (GNAT) family protein [Geodermatophilus tzadiensis]|uniref:Acetyltransferase (GNAT) family protein n=1 Tax=Geodermatophilus tzadiensis TaxID=1137988 RepID=A0A2T0U1U5_9ACTN|nr:GNAT family N-acetyltransferase [Geodermatophilus tzadiensis]PRY51885.1 acetyltransferase (GNAT) family protein [Geodermatophilus tzadiensis]